MMDSIISMPDTASASAYDLFESTSDLELEIEELADFFAARDID